MATHVRAARNVGESAGNGKRFLHGKYLGNKCFGLGANLVTSEPFLAVVNDELWELHGDDINIVVHSDGHCGVWWRAIPCPWVNINSVFPFIPAATITT